MKKILGAIAPLGLSSTIQLALVLGVVFNARFCFGEWIKTIHCPAGHIYRDVRKYAGREEYCEVVKPGLLVFKDGPYRSWFSEGHPGSSGQYLMGRQVGEWKECDRFDRCRQHKYPAAYPRELRRRGFKQEVPISYHDGEYVMDFQSCRSTWVTQATGADPINLNTVGDYPYHCQVSYIPQNVLDHGGKGSYVCFIPFEVGKRKLASLDLRKELPLLGLPQFCKEVSKTGEPLMIRDDVWNVATSVDVECATITPGKIANGTLKIRLNQFASDLVRKASENPATFNTLLCQKPILSPKLSVDESKRTVLTYKFSSDSAQAEKQERCVKEQFNCQMPCR